MGYLLVLVIVIFYGFSSALKKKYMEDTVNARLSLEMYFLITYPFATLFYFVLAKGEVSLNIHTFWFAVVFAVVCICSNLFGMIAYRFTSLVYITVFTGAGSVVVPFLFELVLRGEFFTRLEILSVVLRLAAICVPIFMMEKTEKNTNKGICICILLFVISGAANIISKLYGEHPSVNSDSTFCFWTNMITMPFIFTRVIKQEGIKAIVSESKKIKRIDYLYAVVNVIIGNMGSLLMIQALRLISATFYSVLSSALNMIIMVLMSVCLYKEKLTREAMLSVILSILAIVLGVAS